MQRAFISYASGDHQIFRKGESGSQHCQVFQPLMDTNRHEGLWNAGRWGGLQSPGENEETERPRSALAFTQREALQITCPIYFGTGFKRVQCSMMTGSIFTSHLPLGTCELLLWALLLLCS
jgi:hypothetical protein